MKKRNLVVTLACTIAAATSAQCAHAEEQHVNCKTDTSPSYIKSSIVNNLKNKSKAKKLGCAGVKADSVELVGELNSNCGEGNEDCIRNLVQEFKGEGFQGHATVTWAFHRAGFSEVCDIDISDCKKQ